MYNQIRIVWIVRFEMHCKIMWTVHTFVHHKNTGLYDCAFTGFEYHRTDGQLRRSAPLQDFDIRLFLESQYTVAGVGDFDGERQVRAKMLVAVIYLLPIHCDGWRTASIAPLPGEQEYGKDDEHPAQRQKQPGEFLLLFQSLVFFAHRVSLIDCFA
jgi:hypothetical protein